MPFIFRSRRGSGAVPLYWSGGPSLNLDGHGRGSFQAWNAVDDGTTNFERRGGRRRGSVANVNSIAAVNKQEIVHHASIRLQGLRAHTSVRRHHVRFSYFRNQLLKTA